MSLSQSNAALADSDEPTGQTVPDGETAPSAEAAREARHAARLRHLEMLRNIGMEIAAGLGHAAAGRAQFNIQAYERVADPATSFTRIALAIRRIVALEDRLDEDAATRAARLAEEKAARERQAARESWAEEKRIVRRAVTEACKDTYPDMGRDRREPLLDDLFRRYDDYNRGTLAEIVAGICGDLGIEPDLTLWQDDETPGEGGSPDPAIYKARSVELAEEFLRLVMPSAAPPPEECGQGPPGAS